MQDNITGIWQLKTILWGIMLFITISIFLVEGRMASNVCCVNTRPFALHVPPPSGEEGWRGVEWWWWLLLWRRPASNDSAVVHGDITGGGSMGIEVNIMVRVAMWVMVMVVLVGNIEAFGGFNHASHPLHEYKYIYWKEVLPAPNTPGITVHGQC